jgi:hypothetical protein
MVLFGAPVSSLLRAITEEKLEARLQDSKYTDYMPV